MNSIILVPLRFHLLGLLGWHSMFNITDNIANITLTTLTDIWAVFPNCILFCVSRIQYWYFIASKYLCGKFIRMLTMFGLQIRDFWETFSKLNSNILHFYNHIQASTPPRRNKNECKNLSSWWHYIFLLVNVSSYN